LLLYRVRAVASDILKKLDLDFSDLKTN